VKRKRRSHLGARSLYIVAALIFLFELTPLLTVVLSSFGTTGYTTFPPQGFTLHWYQVMIEKGDFNRAIIRSLLTAVIVVAVSIGLGVPAALALVRYRFPGRDLLNLATLSPLIIPEIVIAVALLQFFAVIGLRPSLTLLVIGHVMLTFPYVVRTVSASLHGFDRSLEDAARSLGAGPLGAFTSVTLPLIKPGVFAGALFAFIVSIELVVISMFLSEVNTVPVEMYWKIRFHADPTVTALASLMVLATIPLMIVVDRLVGLSTFVGAGQA
jgi:putative spermidine/putrescine transport system permease protein